MAYLRQCLMQVRMAMGELVEGGLQVKELGSRQVGKDIQTPEGVPNQLAVVSDPLSCDQTNMNTSIKG